MKLLKNARIYRLDSQASTASSMVIDKDCILAVGGDEILAEFDNAKVEDMQGLILLPGLTDAHIHLQNLVLGRDIENCETETKEEFLHRVAERANRSSPGEWVRGHGWNQNNWGGIWPTATELDAASPHNPTYLTAKSLHAAAANTAALNLSGVTSSTPDPVGGFIQRDARGIPTGILIEEAMKLVESVIPEPIPEDLAKKIHQIIPDLWRKGLTGVHDFDGQTCLLAVQILNDRRDLQLRVTKSIPLKYFQQAVQAGLRSGSGDDFLRIGSLKLFADGALGPHTGAMIDPYVDDPKNRGILLMDADQLFELGKRAVRSGLSLAVHAIGDRAIREMLNGFVRLRRHEHENRLPEYRHRIEHVQTIHPDDAGRLADLGLIASMQPSHATADMLMADRLLGSRAAFSFAWRTQLQHKARLAFGSDAPVEDPNPFLGIHAAVTRCRTDGTPQPEGWYPQQRLTVREALEGYSLGPAYATGLEHRLGQLSPGFLADMIALQVDPFTCDPAELSGILPVATMVGGEWVWQS